MNPLGEMGAERFLREYWQKRPLLLRQAFPDFKPVLDADDIAGLACEDGVEARLLTGSFPRQDWDLRYGPFTEQTLLDLPPARWTLLVQDVEKHYPPLAEVLEAFSFLPRWRIDDVMISVAGPEGSVGPHVDQYDVFLLQAQGRRRWQIAEQFDPALLADTDLNVLQSFSAEQEWVLEPGDMLYLPPGIAHHGIALETGMTWSIGMRAPSSADLLQSLGEWLATHHDEGARYADPGLERALRPGEIDEAAADRFRQLCRDALSPAGDFRQFLGAFLSAYRLAFQPAPPAQPRTQAQLQDALTSGAVLKHNPWTRLLWTEKPDGAWLFAAGSAWPCTAEAAQWICDPARLARSSVSLEAAVLQLCCELLNQGHLYLSES
jgi:50S ribosomal protein L16 3-hydroxylase